MGDSQCNSGAIIEAFDERHHAPRRPLARARRPRERLRNPAPRAIANGRHGAAVARRHVADAGGWPVKLPAVASVKLSVVAFQAGRVGKYTSFLIRRGAPPVRRDRCLPPGTTSPSPCR